MEDALVQERLNLFGPNGGVLILVVMEDALVRLISLKFNASIFLVLILVVMEDALVLGESIDLRKAKLVLILVVMEDALVHDNTWDYYTVS